MKKISVKVKKLAHFKGELPKYETEHASGFDMRAQIDSPISLKPGSRSLIATGLSVEIPPGFEIQIRPRSGWAVKKGISVINTPGTIDADYRGEIKICLANLGEETIEIVDQDRIAQAVLCPVFKAELELVDELSASDRGAGGFGSTGMRTVTTN